MSYISENEILELYLEGEISDDDIFDLHLEGHLSENITTELLGEKAMDYLKTVAKTPIVAIAKGLAQTPRAALYGGLGGSGGAFAGGTLGGIAGSYMGPIGAAAGAKYGAAIGTALGTIAGAHYGIKTNRFDRGVQRNIAKIENWGHDKHFRNSHRKELVKAIKRGDHAAIDHHRHEMMMHQDRMIDRLDARGAPLHDMDHYDDNGNLIKSIDKIVAKNSSRNKDRYYRVNSSYKTDRMI